jgi:hypothetical protein
VSLRKSFCLRKFYSNFLLAVYGGSPAAFVEDFPETAKELMIDVTQSFYQNFKPIV